VEALIGNLPVSNLTLSPDGKRVAYIVKKDKRWVVSVNGQTGAEYDNVLPGSLQFSPDSKSLMYSVLQGGRWSRVVVDGQSGVRVDTNRGNLTSGTTSKHVVHIDQMGKRFSVVVDGKASAECDDFFGPVFSPDGKRVAFGVRQNGLWSVVLDGNSGAEYGAISSLVFSPDSKRVAYAAGTRKSWVIIVDGQVYAEDAGRPLEMLKTGDPTVKGHGLNSSVDSGQHVFSHDMAWAPEVSFSPDSKRVVYTAETGEGMKRSRVVVDGNASQGFHRVISPTFSPDGKHIAYVAITTLFKSLTPKWSMVVDDQVSAEYTRILASPTFSSDGSLEFLAVKGAGMVKEGSLYSVKYIPLP
jgi:Tol biopolymer transport system component